MNSVEIRIMNASGLHARHATQSIKVLDKFHSEISVIKGDRKVSGKSIMGLMSLAISKGITIKIEAEGPDEQQAIDALVNFIEHELDD